MWRDYIESWNGMLLGLSKDLVLREDSDTLVTDVVSHEPLEGRPIYDLSKYPFEFW